MKNIKILLLLILGLSLSTSCIDDNDNELTGDAITGSLLTLNTPIISYVVGNSIDYVASGNVYQGEVQTLSVDIYKSFTDSQTEETSNEVLFKTLTIESTDIGTTGSFSTTFDYDDLISELTLGGNSLSTNDGDLNIGDFWTLRYVSTTSNGNINTNSISTRISVATRFAGTYKVIASDYYRIGVQSSGADWVDEERVIESVDATTYRHLGVGPFDPQEIVSGFGLDIEESYLYFSIKPDDTLNYEMVGNTTLIGVPYISCVTNPSEFNNITCGTDTNYVIRDDVDGKDIIYMTYGYLTSSGASGPREFYEVLEKIVE